MNNYQSYKIELDYILNYHRNQELEIIVEKLEKISKEMLSTIQELEPVEIDSEFFKGQRNKHKLHSNDFEYVFKEKLDGTKVKVGRVFSGNDVELYKPKRLISPTENLDNWSTYWLTKDRQFKFTKFEPSNRINEIFEDPWSIYEFNALGYKTPNGTSVHYDSYID